MSNMYLVRRLDKTGWQLRESVSEVEGDAIRQALEGVQQEDSLEVYECYQQADGQVYVSDLISSFVYSAEAG